MKDSIYIKQLFSKIRSCSLCIGHLPHGANPIIRGTQHSKILIIGQAPGSKVHASSIPWDDQSGERLRNWLGVNQDTFYDEEQVAIVPMGFCYPGKGNSGDLPPRKECAPKWHQQVLEAMPNIKLTLLIGQYAQNYYLPDKMSLTARVTHWANYMPKYMVLPHPSPRNNIWLNKHPWFEKKLVPKMQSLIKDYLGQSVA